MIRFVSHFVRASALAALLCASVSAVQAQVPYPTKGAPLGVASSQILPTSQIFSTSQFNPCTCYYPQGFCPFPQGNCVAPIGNCVAPPISYPTPQFVPASPQFVPASPQASRTTPRAAASRAR